MTLKRTHLFRAQSYLTYLLCLTAICASSAPLQHGRRLKLAQEGFRQ
jgi:hypothetical protein